MTMTADGLAALYRERIHAEQLKPGDRLPSLAELQQLHGVGAGAAGRAIGKLRSEGLIESQHGRGNFVKAPPPKVNVTDNWADAVQRGTDPDRIATVLRVAKVLPPPPVQEILGVAADEQVVERHARVDFRGAPGHLEWTYYPADLAFGTDILLHDVGEGGVYERLAERGARVDRFVEEIVARLPSPAEAELLAVRQEVPVLEVTRTTWAGRRAVEAGRAILNAELYQVTHETVLRKKAAKG
ncbi:GntR family transcriptional regulator [Actinoplanes campanulatus]|uniref:GntR family transcriptional regulator n=1 Tax=Actinoplanes campanulatus TaxID=113559 RepID=A0A7W5FI35_9ACTN|nr:GntR family transcriptional regulator [Actinoplanes campanulatus]MBB3099102.1 GntR family transcriptional regulator [Actinoplanes campanulatus]GGN39048.1 GntR family transcriptional regulator [Actinoplanes campanulatus]GID40258.1 GntR family transcriptional regulator [Actinoplanes campanulatus]